MMEEGQREDSGLRRAFEDAGMNEIAARILEAALFLFAQKGYAATSVREIVQAAQVTNPMLYYYFESKEGVFQRLVEVLFAGLNGMLEEVLAGEGSAREKLGAEAQVHFDGCRENPEALRLIYSMIFGPRQGRPECGILEKVQRAHELVEAVMVAALERGELDPRLHDARMLAERFMGLVSSQLIGVLAAEEYVLLEGAQGEYERVRDELLGEEALERLLEFFFHGAGAPAQEQ